MLLDEGILLSLNYTVSRVVFCCFFFFSFLISLTAVKERFKRLQGLLCVKVIRIIGEELMQQNSIFVLAMSRRGVLSLSFSLSLSLSFSLRNINIRNIRTFRDERLG